jgi:immune inhibitor A
VNTYGTEEVQMKIIRLVLVIAFTIGLIQVSAWAMPLSPKALEKAQAMGILADEVLAPPPAHVNAPGPIPATGHIGAYKLLLITIQFSDQAYSYSTATFDNMAFTSWPTGTMNDYYTAVSYGNLTLSGQVKGWYTAGNTRAYYGNGQKGWGTYPQNAAKLVEEAVDAAETAGCDFSQYDNDGDGMAESIIIVHSGEGSETSLNSNDIQSHVSTITAMGGTARSYDGVTIDRYACCPELQDASPLTHINIGVFCHEYGHILGNPDLYDVSRYCTSTTSWGIGAWGLMCYGGWGGDVTSPEYPSHMCAWIKERMGWLTPTVITGTTTGATLSALETNAQAFKLGMDSRETEYFLIEYRDSSGFDRRLPKKGLLIYHVDDDMWAENDCENGGTCTSYGFNYMVALEQPDGSFHLDCGTAGNYGDRGDAYPYAAVNSFTSGTTPNTNTYRGTASGVSVTNIGWSGSQMQMNISVGNLYDEKAYDDGYYNVCWSYGFNDVGFALKITPDRYPALVKGLLMMSCNYTWNDYQCRIWDDSGTGGTPGSPLTAVHTVMDAPSYFWMYEDFTADSVIVTSGDIWAVYIEYNNSQLASDNDSPWSGRTMTYYAGNFTADYGAYGNYMIRAIIDDNYCAGVDPKATPDLIARVSPNPFRGQANLAFSMSEAGVVALSVYDVSGRLVREVASRAFPAGSHSLIWDGTDKAGRPVGAGIYFYRFTCGEKSTSGKMSLLR